MARLICLTVVPLVLAAAASPAGAQPSPYPAADRYGPSSATAPATPYGSAQVAPAAPAPFRGRVLMWPGKVALRTAPSQAAPAPAGYGPPSSGPTAAGRGAWPSAYADPRAAASWRAARPPASAPGPYPQYAGEPAQAYAAPPAYGPATYGAPAAGWRPVFTPAGAQGVPVQRSAPSASYTAPAQGYSPAFAAANAAPPNRAFAADRRYGYDPTQNHSVRFYSVSRPFGLKPDPAPIPPQFFTATADLSGGDPPGPLPVSHTTAATRAAVVGGDNGGQ